MSEDVDEGYLSEGEVFVPKKRSKKDVSNQDGSQVVVVTDGNRQPSWTLNENVEVRAPEPPPSNKNSKKMKKQTKMNNVCHLWLQRKCHRGKNCKYLHEKKKPGHKPHPKTEEDDAVEEIGKPKSLYAAVRSPSCFRLTVCSYCKVKWKGRISSCYKYYCISGSAAY